MGGRGELETEERLTKMSPFKSSPGSMVMQMLVWLSPWTLLWERGGQRDRGLLRGLSSVPSSSCPSTGGLSGKLTDASLSPPPRKGSKHPSSPCPQSSASVIQHSWPLIPAEYLLDARCVDRLHGLVDPEKWSTPCKGGVVLAKTAEIARGGRGRGEMQEGRTNQEEEK